MLISLYSAHLTDMTTIVAWPHIVTAVWMVRKFTHVNLRLSADFAVMPQIGIMAKNWPK